MAGRRTTESRCHQKVAHATLESAFQEASRCASMYGNIMEAYQCDKCGRYHLTSNISFENRTIISQFLAERTPVAPPVNTDWLP